MNDPTPGSDRGLVSGLSNPKAYDADTAREQDLLHEPMTV
jgi:hypothetical protein